MEINIDLEKQIADAVAAAIAPEKIGELIQKNVSKVVEDAVNSAFSYSSPFRKLAEKSIAELFPHELKIDKQADWNHFITHAINERLTAYNEQRLTEVIMPTLDKLLEKPPESVKLSEIVRLAVAHWREYDDDIDPKLEVKRDHGRILAGYSQITISKRTRSYSSSITRDIYIACNENGEVYSVKMEDHDISKTKFAGPFFNIEQKLFNLYACRTKLEIDVEDIDNIDFDDLEIDEDDD